MSEWAMFQQMADAEHSLQATRLIWLSLHSYPSRSASKHSHSFEKRNSIGLESKGNHRALTPPMVEHKLYACPDGSYPQVPSAPGEPEEGTVLQPEGGPEVGAGGAVVTTGVGVVVGAAVVGEFVGPEVVGGFVGPEVVGGEVGDSPQGPRAWQ